MSTVDAIALVLDLQPLTAVRVMHINYSSFLEREKLTILIVIIITKIAIMPIVRMAVLDLGIVVC